ncbi:MAG: PAS domain S-box protein, partial [Candidatus Deferrimicrobiaceae bacterium]
MKRHSLLQRFFLFSLAAFLMAGFALGAILTSSIEKSAINRSKNDTARFVAAEVDRMFPGMDFSVPMTGPRYENFQKGASHLKFDPSIKRIKVWNPDSFVVWSDERQLVGKQFPNNKELLGALNGTISSEISSLVKQDNPTERQYHRLMELYIPIRTEREGNVKAVFEIYQDLENLDADTSRQKRILWISIVAGFSGIYFACLGIVWRASRSLTEQTLEVEKSEARNRALAQELTSLINNVPGIVYRGYRDWSISFVGGEVEPATGHTSDEFTSGSAKWKEIIHPDDLKRVKEAYRKADKEKADTLRLEYRIRNKDGAIRWIADKRQLVYDAEGNFSVVDGLLLDITDQKSMEETLQNQFHFLHVILDAIPTPIFYKDARGVFLGCNKAYEEYIGLPNDRLVGKTVYDIAPKDLADTYRDADDALFRKGGSQVYETGMVPADGKRHDVIFSKATFTNPDGSLGGLVGTILDITERKRSEEALTRLGMAVDQAAEGIVITDTEGRIEYVNPS